MTTTGVPQRTELPMLGLRPGGNVCGAELATSLPLFTRDFGAAEPAPGAPAAAAQLKSGFPPGPAMLGSRVLIAQAARDA